MLGLTHSHRNHSHNDDRKNDMSEVYIGSPRLDPDLADYPHLLALANSLPLELETRESRRSTSIWEKKLLSGERGVTDEVVAWTVWSTGLPADNLSLAECAPLFVEVNKLVLLERHDDACQLLFRFQVKKLGEKSPRREFKAQVSVVVELEQLAWETDEDSASDEEYLGYSSESSDSTDDEMDQDEMDTDESDDDEGADQMDCNSESTRAEKLLFHLTSTHDQAAFDAFCQTVPDKYQAALWRTTFWENKAWWLPLCQFWNEKLDKSFFGSSLMTPEEAYTQSVRVIRQMRTVKTRSECDEWVSVLKTSGLGKTICRISDVLTLLDGANVHADDLFLRIRAQDSLCETLDSWIAEAASWAKTPIKFEPRPRGGSQPLDPEDPGLALWEFMLKPQNDNLIPHFKLPQSVQLLACEATFTQAWHSWYGISLEARGVDLTGVDAHSLYASLMDTVTWVYRKKKKFDRVLNPVWRKILTRTIELRETSTLANKWAFEGKPMRQGDKENSKDRKQREQQWEQYNLEAVFGPNPTKKFPDTACIKCWELPVEDHCRRSITVEDQDVEFLRGCGITCAPEGARMEPKAPPKNRSKNKAPPRLWTPEDIRARKLKFEGIKLGKRHESIIERCGKQILYIKDVDDELIDVVIYGAFSPVVLARLKEHHNAAIKCKPVRRGGGFDWFSDGKMIPQGSSGNMGGTAASGYAPLAGFNAKTLDGIDIIFNEVEDATVMLETIRAFHPRTYSDLVNETKAADRMGKSGINTYKCTGYCVPQHADEDVCRGVCMTLELVALDWEYAFCQPSYGYYLQTYPNTLWTFDSARIHGTMLPATTLLPGARLRGGARHRGATQTPRAARAAKRSNQKWGGRVSTGTHVSATSKNVAKAQKYEAIRAKREPRKRYWNA
ncbi:hypothetical protein DFH09DRAFT_1188393 [Mycena vulgaris]|nr:hypothetical protein DFH09DRAFT_1188393 [Mycena vulgaris]